MKILWVKPGKLLPLDTGGKLRTYNILRHLSAREEVTFLSYYGGKPDHSYDQEIQTNFPGTVVVHTEVPEITGLKRYLDYVRRFPSAIPYSVIRFTSHRAQKVLAEWLSERQFDVAVCDFLASTLNFPRLLKIPTVLFQHNVESLLWNRRAQFETNLPDRLIAKMEYAKMARFEPMQVRRFHHVFAVSEEDRKFMGRTIDPARITVIPTGVDLVKYRYDANACPSAGLVAFVGSMDWAPNVDGVEYFCKQVWPLVLSRVPDACFRIVGRNPDARVRRLASASVEVTGSVPDVVDHLRAAAAIVVPLRIGGGTRIKIFEAMAMGKATVSTRLGADGLDVRHGHDILLADEPRQFAEYVVELLCDEQSRKKYEKAAAATAHRHDWSKVAQTLLESFRAISGRPLSTGIVSAPIAAEGP